MVVFQRYIFIGEINYHIMTNKKQYEPTVNVTCLYEPKIDICDNDKYEVLCKDNTTEWYFIGIWWAQ